VERLSPVVVAIAVNVMGRPSRARSVQARSIALTVWLLRPSGGGLRVGDQGVEACEEFVVAFGLVDPSSSLVVPGACFGVDALGGQDRQGRGVGAVAGAGFTDVRVAAGALGGNPPGPGRPLRDRASR